MKALLLISVLLFVSCETYSPDSSLDGRSRECQLIEKSRQCQVDKRIKEGGDSLECHNFVRLIPLIGTRHDPLVIKALNRNIRDTTFDISSNMSIKEYENYQDLWEQKFGSIIEKHKDKDLIDANRHFIIELSKTYSCPSISI